MLRPGALSAGSAATRRTKRGRRRRVTPHPRSGAVAESARLRQHRNGREDLPKSKVRGSSREELPHVLGQWRPGGDTSSTSPGAVALRSDPALEARDGSQEEPCCAPSQGQRLGGAT